MRMMHVRLLLQLLFRLDVPVAHMVLRVVVVRRGVRGDGGQAAVQAVVVPVVTVAPLRRAGQRRVVLRRRRHHVCAERIFANVKAIHNVRVRYNVR